MVKIKIRDYLSQASTYEDGDVIFRKVSSLFEDGQAVDISFEGIHAVPSAFINSAFVRLVESFEFDYIKKNLIFTDSTKFINDLIKSRFEFARRS